MFSGPLPAILREMFPTNVRFTALSISYGFAVMIFGGFAPFIGAFLVNVTGNPISPTCYVNVDCDRQHHNRAAFLRTDGG
jgi:MFS transporter, MHS family, proline/betaine transporter